MNLPEENVETVHVYVYDKPSKPWFILPENIVHRCVQLLACIYLAAFCLLPASQMYTFRTVIVKAIPLLTQTFQDTVPIQASGVQIIPATNAHGVLTIYNGLSVYQSLPIGFILSTAQKIEIATDKSVTIPPGTIYGYGVATVSAHALDPGYQGNIQAGAIDTVYGASLYIKNMSAFEGGADEQTLHYVTEEDQINARQTARKQLQIDQSATKHPGLAVLPCQETETQASQRLSLTWTCQDVTYIAPKNGRVISAQATGKVVILRMKVFIGPQ